MNQNARGIYLNPMHDRTQDWDFLRAWQPNVIRLMLPGNHNNPTSVDVDRIKRDRELGFRLWLGMRLIALAAIAMNCDIKVGGLDTEVAAKWP